MRTSPSSSIAAALLVVTALAGGLAPGKANAALTGTAGGSGGTAFQKMCSKDQVLVGFYAKSGIYIDGLIPLCAQVGMDGKWVSEPVARDDLAVGGAVGVDKATAQLKVMRCPGGVVAGIKGRAQDVVDQLQVVCATTTRGGAVAVVGMQPLTGILEPIGSIFNPGSTVIAGGTGGRDFGPLNCINNQPAIGIVGRAGIVLDQIGLVCNLPAEPLALRELGAQSGNGLSFGFPFASDAGRNAPFYVLMSAKWKGSAQLAFSAADPSVVSVPATKSISAQSGSDIAYMEIQPRAPGCTTIEATYGGDRKSITALVNRPDQRLRLALDKLSIQSAGILTLELPAPAPAGGAVVTLSSTRPTVTRLPPTVTIPAGSRLATLDIHPFNNSLNEMCAVITGTTPDGAMPAVALLIPRSSLQLTSPTTSITSPFITP